MTNRHTTARATALIAGALAATLALAGCVPTDPTPTPTATKTSTPTPTPTPTEVAAPETADEAIAGATDAMARYIDVRSAIYVDPTKPQDIAAVAEGTAAERLKSTQDQLAAAGDYGKGAYAFEVISGYASPLEVKGEQFEFGQVTLNGCYDKTGIELFNADGTPADRAESERIILNPVLIYRPATSSWAVYQLESPEETQTC